MLLAEADFVLLIGAVSTASHVFARYPGILAIRPAEIIANQLQHPGMLPPRFLPLDSDPYLRNIPAVSCPGWTLVT